MLWLAFLLSGYQGMHRERLYNCRRKFIWIQGTMTSSILWQLILVIHYKVCAVSIFIDDLPSICDCLGVSGSEQGSVISTSKLYRNGVASGCITIVSSTQQLPVRRDPSLVLYLCAFVRLIEQAYWSFRKKITGDFMQIEGLKWKISRQRSQHETG